MSMKEQRKRIGAKAMEFLERSPLIKEAFPPYYQATYEPGVLDTKTKRLMALCVGITHACTGCILGQTDRALEAGATAEEVIEACGVAMSMGGTLAWSQMYKVLEYLDENGLLK